MSTPQSHTLMFGTSSLGGFWLFFQRLQELGPSWGTVPPLLIALAGLVGACNSFLDGLQKRRHEEEIHRAKLEASRISLAGPSFDALEARG